MNGKSKNIEKNALNIEVQSDLPPERETIDFVQCLTFIREISLRIIFMNVFLTMTVVQKVSLY